MNALAHPEYTIDLFEAGEIDAERFDHESHVYVAWLYVEQYPLHEAIGRFDAALKRLVTKLGAESKYHATLTWFFLLLVAERSNIGEPWQVFRQRNLDLVSASRETLSRYYNDEYLFSDRARQHFLLPDKLRTDQR